MSVPLADPVFEVTGVPAAELLRRIAAARDGRPVQVSGTAGASAAGRWNLLDFGDGTDGQFVEAAHEVLLRRPVTAQERSRRLADLRSGSSRLEVLVRLAMCPEGRRATRQPVSGAVLPALTAAGRALEQRGGQRLDTVSTTVRPVVAGLLGRTPRARTARGAAKALLVLGGGVLTLRSNRGLRTQVEVLTRELSARRAEAGA